MRNYCQQRQKFRRILFLQDDIFSEKGRASQSTRARLHFKRKYYKPDATGKLYELCYIGS